MSETAKKATTFRLDPNVKEGLERLSKLLHKPLNKLANEAISAFVAQNTLEVEKALESTLEDLRRYRQSDPGFEKAIGKFAESEAAATGDPAEGRITERKVSSETIVSQILKSKS